MRFAKTFCKPNAQILAVPAGLPIKLQYNEFGLFQKFTIGIDPILDPMYEDNEGLQAISSFNQEQLLQSIKKYVPSSISTTGGTTWIYGVLYSHKIPCIEGMLDRALYNGYIEEILKGEQFVFYAGYATSKAISLKGPLTTKSFLGAAGFNVLPQITAPVQMTDQTLASLLDSPAFIFKKEFIAGFFIYEELGCRYCSSGLLQVKVTNNITPFVDADGFLKGKVETETGQSYIFDYSAIIHHDITKGSCLLAERISDSRLSVLVTRVNESSEKTLNNTGVDIKCPVCNKLYRIGTNDAPVQCDDPHCLSRSYQDVVKMLAVLNLPEMSYESYKDLVDSKEIICMTDILEIEPYRSIDISTTLAEAMYAVIPTSVAPNFEVLLKFANKCNNSTEVVRYYLENPLRIETDLDITDPLVRKLIAWLEDPYNITTVITIFSQVDIISKQQKFDGAPIFRGNTIAVTGRFRHGDYPEIESILMSYAAKVIPSIESGEPLPDVVLVGSLNDGISGYMIQKANKHNIPIMYEDDFFTKYEIDKDLEENLL